MKKLLLATILVLSSLTAMAQDVQVEAPQSEDYVLFVSVKIKPEHIQDFKKLVLPYSRLTAQEEGNFAYVVHQSQDNSSEFEIYEHWKSEEGRSVHLKYDHTVKFFSAVKGLFEEGYPKRKKVIRLK